MIKLRIIIALTCFSLTCHAQIQVQPFFGNDGLQIGSLVNKTFSKKEKWNYFNYTSYFTEYNNIKSGQIESYQNVSYAFYKNFGLNIGTSFGNANLTPSLGLSYILDKDKINISIFPSINYIITEKGIGADLNAMLEYTPAINKVWNLYSMLIFNGDYFENDFEAKEYVRVGLEHKNKLQFGLGSDIENTNSTFNIGAFIGYTF